MQKLLTEGIGHTDFKDSELGRIPQGWEVQSVGKMLESQILSSVQDGNHGNDHPKASDYVENGIPFLMASDIRNGKINYNDCKKISEEQYNSLRIGFSYQNDILLTHKATIGLTSIVKGIDKIMLTPQVTAYRIKNFELLFGEYLFYYFQSQYFQKLITMLSKQSTRSYIGITAQKKLLVILPDLSEQKQIAEILSTVDKKLENLKEKKQSFEELKKGLMQKLLTGEVRV